MKHLVISINLKVFNSPIKFQFRLNNRTNLKFVSYIRDVSKTNQFRKLKKNKNIHNDMLSTDKIILERRFLKRRNKNFHISQMNAKHNHKT